jgi:hypothetical protein
MKSPTASFDPIDRQRRRLLGIAARMTVVTPFLIGGAVDAMARSPVDAQTGNGSFGALRQIDAGDLSIQYADVGPKDGRPVVLLHGWPYDIHAFTDVAPLLVQAGYRVVVPYLRGYGGTVIRSAGMERNGQQSALALDIIALR